MESEFGSGESGASYTYPKQAGNLKKGDYAVLKGHPCKIVEISTSKTGKHGHAKANITGLDIFTSNKYQETCPTSHMLSCPNVERQEFQLINIDEDGFVSLMTDTGVTRDDIKLE
mmetsp:Transcript_19485/g.9055  ORF Transcript_19485/g.9055 Transcript_19485/m.9055 type:complete len:115 (-) Transcript_19485:745-1089(-)|eukprot:CAMPEP_0201284314 /NCGR_PEP_ID=MMETSP1317-20130820/69740_1 /ASSEMBLY_ACC=CAM_ASM_000770 /TAXON_ID=187299 /ORGANISM="Undescribed Undescribed, Strain Undescribed" /LENGTH=114 /DNA_ID=CAMNT_0047603931 /DNA_START=21 /DNA_END=365 /DNA_ORIENTATION=-